MKKDTLIAKDMFKVLLNRKLYLDIFLILFLWSPMVVGLALLSRKVDSFLGLSPFIEFPANIIFSFIFFISGITIVWRAYAYLVIVGEGGPCPQLGGTNRLVTVGPYSRVRHPSVIGKLLGVISLGCLLQATTFTFVIVPLLFIASTIYNRFIQEKGCVKKFGEAYLEYRQQVPMFIPKLKRPKAK